MPVLYGSPSYLVLTPRRDNRLSAARYSGGARIRTDCIDAIHRGTENSGAFSFLTTSTMASAT